MNTSRENIPYLALVLFIGAALGASVSLGYTLQEIESLEERLDDREQVVHINGSATEESLADLFSQVERSAVSVNVFGGSNSQGSGFVYSTEGHIVTNHHVVEDAERVEVTFTDGLTENAEVVGADPYTDLAVLKVDRQDLEPLETGDLSEVEVGQTAVAIGNPFGLQSSMTAGIISQKDRLLPVRGGFSIPNVIQTDAAINPGNSGGPLMNTEGEVVGVNTAIETRTGAFSGIGFAIPADSVERVVPNLIDEGEYRHSWIGVSGVDIGPDIAEVMDLNESKGFLVIDVVEDGPADIAGVRESENVVEIQGREIAVGGDVITAINGEEVRGIDDILIYLARSTEVGEEVELTVIRDGEEQDISVVLQPRPN